MLVKSKNTTNATYLFQQIPLNTLPKISHPILRLNAICPYYTMFPLEFPFSSLSTADKGDWILDPFCGRGTTNFAARLRGLPSIGLDANPVAVAIAQSKFIQTTSSKVIKICHNILDKSDMPEKIPTGEFWEMCYHPDTLNQITQIRESLLENCRSHEKRALRAIMLGILHGPRMKGKPSYLSNQMPRTYATKPGPAVKYWTEKGERPNYIDVLDLVKRRVSFVFSNTPQIVEGNAFLQNSCENFSKQIPKKIKWVVTSPPYYSMRSYVPDQWLRYWFLGGPPDVMYSMENQVRHTSITDFIDDLANVWRNVSSICDPGAHLIVRFGTLPSREKDPASIITESLEKADVGWTVSSILPAGNARIGRRQSDQFLQNVSKPCEEIDLNAVLGR